MPRRQRGGQAHRQIDGAVIVAGQGVAEDHDGEADQAHHAGADNGGGQAAAHDAALARLPMRGSSRACTTSVTALLRKTLTTMTKTTACTTGKSRFSVDCTSSQPMPGQAKMVSMTTRPVSMKASSAPIRATAPNRALGRTWRHRISFSDAPVERAVRTKSAARAAWVLASTTRISLGARKETTEITGSTQVAGPP